jgi:hypothetical protein
LFKTGNLTNIKVLRFLPVPAGSLGVRGSIPLSSTKINKAGPSLTGFFYFDEVGIEPKGV